MAKLLITGDWHITDKTPENRIDDYCDTVKRKIYFILNTAKLENVDCILQPGDFTDSPSMTWKSFIEFTELFNHHNNIPIYTIWGQHDLRYRNKGNTALDAFVSSCPSIQINPSYNSLYCVPYNEDIPTILDQNTFNILLIHKMIIQEKLWAEQIEYTDASNFLRAHQFQLIVSGDNHQSFIVDSKVTKKHLFNCGSLLRNKIDQIDHKPYIIIFDIETKEYKQIFIPINPPEKVFDLEKIKKEKEIKEQNKNLVALITGLSMNKEIGLKFENNLNVYLNEIKADQTIKKIIEDAKT